MNSSEIPKILYSPKATGILTAGRTVAFQNLTGSKKKQYSLSHNNLSISLGFINNNKNAYLFYC